MMSRKLFLLLMKVYLETQSASMIDHDMSSKLFLLLVKEYLETQSPSLIDHNMSSNIFLLLVKVYLETQSPSSHITISLSLLEAQHDEYGQGVSNHISCLKLGLRSLETFLDVSINKDLKMRIKDVVYKMTLELHSLSKKPIDGSRLFLDLDSAYTDLRKKVNNVIINPSTREYDAIFGLNCRGLRKGYVILLRIIEDLLHRNSLVNAAPFTKEIEDLKENLMLLQSLFKFVTSVEVSIAFGKEEHLIPLVAFFDKAVCLLFSCLVDKMDEETVLAMKRKLTDLLENINVKEIYIKVLMASKVEKDNPPGHEFYLLDNMIKLIQINSGNYRNDPGTKLHEKIIFLSMYLCNLPRELRLQKFNYLSKSIQDIAFKAIPILNSCYDKDLKDDVAMEVNGALSEVIDQIDDIQTKVKVTEMHNYPKTDGLGFMDILLEHLRELLNFRSELVELLKSQIETLHTEFDFLRNFLRKIKELRNEYEELGDLWIHIIGLAYQVEYIIDLYLVKCTPNSHIMLSITKIIEQTELIRSKVTKIYDEKRYHTQAINVANTSDRVSPQANEVVGFEDEVEKIMEYILRGTKQRDVVSVVGLPGLGKTTLARKIYEDPLLVEHFDVRAWCTVSQTYWAKELLITILGYIIGITEEINKLNEEELAAKLYQSLKGRRYLIVIDDLWDIEAWDALVRSLPDDGMNSRILVTSRLQNLTSQMKVGSKVHPLRQLSEDESWQLFQKKVFQEESLSQEILDVGKQIAESCKRLPLAIVVIAGVLANMEKSASKWKQIAKNLRSQILSDSEGHFKAILELSYGNLSDHLKSCFLYFGAFKEDEEVPLWKLKWLWIAEGFVRNTGAKSLEDAAEEYLMDLISRSLVTSTEKRSSGGVKACRVHDLLRDFCLEKAKEESFLQVIDVNGGSEYSGPYDQRRLGIHLQMDPDEMAKLSRYNVRSLLYSTKNVHPLGFSFIFENFKLLKVLDICNIYMDEYPRGIELLIHLRYLAMRARITLIPSSICNLWNLQTLLVDTPGRVDVPNSVWDMVNLRHVHINYCASFDAHTNVLGNSLLLENLRTLSTPWFSCRADAENLLRRVPNLQKLRCIFDRCWDDYSKPHQFPVLDVLDQLMSLKVTFKNIWLSKENFELNFPSNLQKLTLKKFPGKLDEISLIGRTLPNLKVLKLYGKKLSGNWNVDDGDFPKLKYLKLSCGIKEWNASDDSFPILEKLVLDSCEMLKEIPSCFGEIPTLHMITVKYCKSSVDDSARRIQKEQQEEWQNYELKVNITITSKLLSWYLLTLKLDGILDHPSGISGSSSP